MIELIFEMAPNVKSLRVFEVTEELMASARKLLVHLEQVEYNFIHQDCFRFNKNPIKFVRMRCLDPLMQIPEELHELIFQHLSDSFVDHLTKTWTKFYFSTEA